MAFMDLEKAYDRIDKNALAQIWRIYGIQGNILNAIQSLYSESTTTRGSKTEVARHGGHGSTPALVVSGRGVPCMRPSSQSQLTAVTTDSLQPGHGLWVSSRIA